MGAILIALGIYTFDYVASSPILVYSVVGTFAGTFLIAVGGVLSYKSGRGE